LRWVRAIVPSLALITILVAIAPALANAAAAERMTGVAVIGTRFRITGETGRIIEGQALQGATLSVVLAGSQAPRRIRLARIVPDPTDPEGEVLLYDMRLLGGNAGTAPLCEDAVDGAPVDGSPVDGAHWAFPLQGQWDGDGNKISDAGFTLTCAADAQGKCVRFGYKPWKTAGDGVSLAGYHQACIRMVRADYCGDRGTTRNGMLIDFYDRLGIQKRSDTPDDRALPFEAAWNIDGALCVAHTRVPANMTLARLGETCPRLGGRLGTAVCNEPDAVSGRFGDALLFNRSR
jgi:hypothetical protein